MFIFGMFAANGLFKQSFKRVIRSPKEFFDTTPVGRILNRFSKDQDVLDSILIQNISASMEMAVAIASVFVSSLLFTHSLDYYRSNQLLDGDPSSPHFHWMRSSSTNVCEKFKRSETT